MRLVGQWLLVAAIICAGISSLSLSAASVPGGNETTNYTYDARGRLIRVERSGSVNNNVQANYSYDKADNRLTVNITGAP